MDRKIWKIVMQAVDRAIRKFKYSGRRPKYSHRLVAGMYFWSAWHNHCLSWACDPAHYGDVFRPRRLPSISRFTRRVKEPIMDRILQHVHRDLAWRGPAGSVLYIDGKPLLVSSVSKDPDARVGHIARGFAKGYKLHAIVNESRRITVWSVTSLNVAEQSVALAMCPHLPPAASPMALTMADSNYDSAPLHKALGQSDQMLLTPIKAQQRVKNGKHHPVTLRQMGPARRAALAVDKACSDLKRFVLKDRNNIEGVFSVLTCVGQLGVLPAFVRRLGRVTRWAGAKIILYHARLLAQENRKLEPAA